jgi:hypothetical protein
LKILTMPQRSPEWFAAREGCLITASEMGPFLSKQDKKSVEARRRLVCQRLCNLLPLDDWTAKLKEKEEKALEYNLDIQRGNAMEEEARAAYARKTGAETAQVGFLLSDCGLFGASADSLVLTARANRYARGLELKCPRRETLMAYHLIGGLPDEYRGQVHGSMVVSGLREWDFFAWHPMLPPLWIRVLWDDFTQAIAEGLVAFAEEFREAEHKAAAVWAAHFGEEAA